MKNSYVLDMKCIGGDSCCTESNQCGINEGDCDTCSQCSGDLVCGNDNCQGDTFEATDDCCMKGEYISIRYQFGINVSSK